MYNSVLKCDPIGPLNPRWRGGPINKVCEVCRKEYRVKRAHIASRFCSLQCVGVSQRGRKSPWTEKERIAQPCATCGKTMSLIPAMVGRTKNCSRKCSYAYRAKITANENNPNWAGGLSNLPYPHNFRSVSIKIRIRDGHRCQNPTCRKNDRRITTHHIDYVKMNIDEMNLITLCRSCNSRANFGRANWTTFYQNLMSGRKSAGQLTGPAPA